MLADANWSCTFDLSAKKKNVGNDDTDSAGATADTSEQAAQEKQGPGATKRQLVKPGLY